jgi:ADP-ribosyl-[dinitrogen reductase] hydrolase
MVDLQDRYRGVLLGLACGDALGGPIEFMSREDIAAQYPGGLREFIGGGWLSLEPGEITDDTQMTLALANSLAEHPSLKMDDLVARFLAWSAGKPKDIGLTTRAALNALEAGASWEVAGTKVAGFASGSAAGNGSVMRCAPVALRFRTDPARLVSATRDSARVTHADPRCQWAAVAVNQGIAHLLNGGKIDQVIEAAAAGIEEKETLSALRKAQELKREQVRSGGFVLDTMQAAYWSLLQTESFEEAAVLAVNLGGDTDTTGAVTGALAGAAYGESAIPARWLDRVQHRAKLTELADRLLEHSEAAR